VVLVNVDGVWLQAAPTPNAANSRWRKIGPNCFPNWSSSPANHIVSKQRVARFLGTNLDDYLRQRSVTRSFWPVSRPVPVVEATARSAYDLGYNVTLVVDAMTDLDADAHRPTASRKVFPRLGETATTVDLLELLKGRQHTGHDRIVE